MKQLLWSLLLVFMVNIQVSAEPFTQAAFEKAVADNHIVLVDIYADWCSTCRKQQQILADYFAAHPESKIKKFQLNFDTQKEWVSYFKAPRQSTFVAYKDGKKVWFAVAETNKERIFNKLQSLEVK